MTSGARQPVEATRHTSTFIADFCDGAKEPHLTGKNNSGKFGAEMTGCCLYDSRVMT